MADGTEGLRLEAGGCRHGNGSGLSAGLYGEREARTRAKQAVAGLGAVVKDGEHEPTPPMETNDQ